MKTYTIKITETLEKIVEIPANCKFEAIDKVEKMYRNEEIVLDYNDLTQHIIEGA